MGWTSWSSCSKTGEQSIKSKICCPIQLNSKSAEECKRICKLTQEQIEVKRSCMYIPTAYLVASTKIVSSSNLVNEQSLTESPSPKDVPNENQTIESYASTNAAEYEKSTSDEVFDNTISSKGGTEITTDTSDIFVSRTVQSSTSLYQENVVASEYQTTYSSSAAENIEYTSDQTFNKPSITDERSGTSVTPPPEASNNRTVIQTPTGEKATSSHEPGYELTSNYVNNYFTKEGTEYHVKSETSNNRTSVPSSTSRYQGKGTTRSAVKTSIPASTVSSSSVSSSSKGNGASNASQLSRNKLQEEGGTGGGVIAGAIIGVLAVAGLSGLLAFFLYRRWKKNKDERKVEPEENGGENPVSQKPPVSTSLN
ncbi:uncharacterized protein LOC128190497 [Crassostrea angulata]|uniref:uncharacterized protein LOC128190497 n=1 Tax=Magallana angulata TaxID=2784310 RepID=UPI0022B09992|nr:uncharacterized protein LOC128190497 [Crassostrea angulata]